MNKIKTRNIAIIWINDDKSYNTVTIPIKAYSLLLLNSKSHSSEIIKYFSDLQFIDMRYKWQHDKNTVPKGEYIKEFVKEMCNHITELEYEIVEE